MNVSKRLLDNSGQCDFSFLFQPSDLMGNFDLNTNAATILKPWAYSLTAEGDPSSSINRRCKRWERSRMSGRDGIYQFSALLKCRSVRDRRLPLQAVKSHS